MMTLTRRRPSNVQAHRRRGLEVEDVARRRGLAGAKGDDASLAKRARDERDGVIERGTE